MMTYHNYDDNIIFYWENNYNIPNKRLQSIIVHLDKDDHHCGGTN